MGTTLTGTTPANTYDSLIKVTDNGPLSGTLKKLTDGLGNDSSLSLSTTAASLSGTLAVSSTIDATNSVIVTGADTLGTNVGIVNTSAGGVNYNIFSCGSSGTLAPAGSLAFRDSTIGATRLVISSAGNVGIGTDSPLAKLQTTTAGTAANEVGLRLNNPNGNVAPTGVDIVFQSGYITGVSGAAVIRGGRSSASNDSYITFLTNSGSGLAEVGRWLPTGGLTFNGDTAAANALDDYEEGTWTGTLKGDTTDPTTPVTATGRYTKIGRMVTAEIQIDSANTTGASGGVAVTGLPFASLVEAQGAVMCDVYTFGALCTSVNCYVSPFGTTMNFFTSGSNVNWAPLTHNAGVGRSLRATLTYFV